MKTEPIEQEGRRGKRIVSHRTSSRQLLHQGVGLPSGCLVHGEEHGGLSLRRVGIGLARMLGGHT